MISDDEVVALRPLLKYMVKRVMGFGDEDALQVAFLAAVQARNSYDPCHGRPYHTWAAYKAEKAVIDYVRNMTGARRVGKTHTVPCEDVSSLMRCVPAFEDEVLEDIDRDRVAKVVREVVDAQPERVQHRLHLLMSGHTKSETAHINGVDATMVSYDMRKLRNNDRLRTVLS